MFIRLPQAMGLPELKAKFQPLRILLAALDQVRLPSSIQPPIRSPPCLFL